MEKLGNEECVFDVFHFPVLMEPPFNNTMVFINLIILTGVRGREIWVYIEKEVVKDIIPLVKESSDNQIQFETNFLHFNSQLTSIS